MTDEENYNKILKNLDLSQETQQTMGKPFFEFKENPERSEEILKELRNSLDNNKDPESYLSANKTIQSTTGNFTDKSDIIEKIKEKLNSDLEDTMAELQIRSDTLDTLDLVIMSIESKNCLELSDGFANKISLEKSDQEFNAILHNLHTATKELKRELNNLREKIHEIRIYLEYLE